MEAGKNTFYLTPVKTNKMLVIIYPASKDTHDKTYLVFSNFYYKLYICHINGYIGP